MFKVKILTRAQNNLDKITEYIAQDNPYRAVVFTQEMLESFKIIVSSQPNIGLKRKNYHIYIYKKYMMLYRVNLNKKIIYLARVIHSANYPQYRNML